MKLLSCLLVTFIISLNVNAQNCATEQNGGVRTEEWLTKLAHSKSSDECDNATNKFFLSINGKFNDTVTVYLNNRILYSQFLHTDSLGRNNTPCLQLVTNKHGEYNNLMIELTNNHQCMTIDLNPKYRIVNVRRKKNVWKVDYANYKSDL